MTKTELSALNITRILHVQVVNIEQIFENFRKSKKNAILMGFHHFSSSNSDSESQSVNR